MVEITHRAPGSMELARWRDKRLAVVRSPLPRRGSPRGYRVERLRYEATYALTVARSPSADTLRPLIECCGL
jgi:hypothetical protein